MLLWMVDSEKLIFVIKKVGEFFLGLRWSLIYLLSHDH